MRLSIVHPVLDSHEIVRRQILHYKKMELPDDIEIIIVDDNSCPPLEDTVGLKNITIVQTNDNRLWTWPIARNMGAEIARGVNILFADIDYIIPKETILRSADLIEDRMNYHRQFGVIDENGEFTQDFDTLKKYGLLESRIRDKGVNVSCHTNTFTMKKEVFKKLGGYRIDRIGRPYPQREDGDFDRDWLKRFNAGEFTRIYDMPMVYMFPNGKFCGDVDFNPFGLFHSTSRKN